MFDVRIQIEAFDVGVEIDALAGRHRDTGAIVSFVGYVRERTAGRAIDAMELEHYPGMTEKALQAIVAQARQRWELLDALVIHRVGRLQIQDAIVLVAVASLHRQAAFEASAFIMDYLKTQAPFWKKEYGAEGAQWVDARESDEAAAARWRL